MVSLSSIAESLPDAPSGAVDALAASVASLASTSSASSSSSGSRLTRNPESGPSVASSSGTAAQTRLQIADVHLSILKWDRWVVQKYGGTSLGKFLDNITNETIPAYIRDGNRVVVVCSARSGSTKLTGTTNLLIRASLEALRPSAANPTASQSPTASQAVTPSLNSSNGTNPLSLTSQQFQRSGSSSVLPTLLNGSASNWQSRANSPGGYSPVGRRSMSNSISSLRDEVGGRGGGASTPGGGIQQQFEATVEQIRNDHLASARSAVRNSPDILEQLEDEIDYDCDQLRSFLMAAQILEEISPRSKDTIIGVGERLSCRIVAAALRDRGTDAELVSLESIITKASEDGDDGAEGSGNATSATAGDNESLGQPFWDRLAKLFGERIAECGDRVPVVTGFFGVVPGSLLTQVGRGYTDLCAALCAVGLNASELQIWKEVDGIFTADPRKVPKARLLPHITPEEAAELTYYGSEVIHPFTMEQVINASIPIRIKNVERPSGAGTVIFPDVSSSHPGTPPVHVSASAMQAIALDPTMNAKIPTAVTIKDSILVLNVRSNRKTISHAFLGKIFGTLDRFGIVVDLISTSEVHVSIAMNGSMRRQLLDKVVAELRKVGDVYVLHEMAILSLVGKQMKNMVGIAGRMFTVLAEAKVNIEMISQGSSEINVSCVIAGRDALKALRMVHGLLEQQHPVQKTEQQQQQQAAQRA